MTVDAPMTNPRTSADEIGNRQVVRRQYADPSRLDTRAGFHAKWGTSPIAWHDWVFDQLDLKAYEAVLEVGCGPAELWSSNLNRLPAALFAALTDISLGMLQAAVERLDGRARGFRFAACDVTRLPFADSRFDLVVANHMLYHVSDVEAALGEIRRVTRTGGRLYAATVGRGHMKELFQVAHEVSAAAAATPAQHIESFSLDTGHRALASRYAKVRFRRFPNDLVVRDAASLMGYLLSTETGRALSGAERRTCSSRFQAAIDREGAFRITGMTGLFEADAL